MFSEDQDFCSSSDLFRVKISPSKIKEILQERNKHKIFMLDQHWDCIVEGKLMQNLSSEQMQNLFENFKLNLQDSIKKIQEQNFYQLKKWVKKYYIDTSPKNIQIEKPHKKRDRFSFEVE